jgi:xanthine dehydrogenase molybdopterin-binding subunit B
MQQPQQTPKKKKKIRVPRVVNGVETMVEIEVDDETGPEWGANDKHALLNHSLRRVDGPLKVTGAAHYTYDRTAPGMLHGRLLRSPHAHASVLKVDASAALRIPGVKAIVGATNEDVVEESNKPSHPKLLRMRFARSRSSTKSCSTLSAQTMPSGTARRKSTRKAIWRRRRSAARLPK